MKKMMIITMLFILVISVFPQEEGKYNRFRHSREEYIEIGRDLAESYNKNIDCDDKEIKTDIIEYKSIFYSDTSSFESKREAMHSLGHTNCPDVIDFYVDILNNDTSMVMRNDALLYLGWLRAKSSIPHLLEAAKQNNGISFVIRIATTLNVIGEFDKAASVLDRVCFNEEGSVISDCIEAYAFAGRNEIVKNYWMSEWEKDNDDERKFHIALHLTKCGIYDITFPIIKEALLSTDRYKRHSALNGLGAIATDEALELIKTCMNDNDIMIANYAKNIITSLKEGRRYK
jgi:HEAT repeat protein